jgi:hypothetical protein
VVVATALLTSGCVSPPSLATHTPTTPSAAPNVTPRRPTEPSGTARTTIAPQATLTPAPSLGAREDFISWFQAKGFTGRESRDVGIPLWVAQRAADAHTVTLAGDPLVAEIRLLTVGIDETRATVGDFLSEFYPDLATDMDAALNSYAGTDVDVEKSADGVEMQVVTITLPPPLGNGQVSVSTTLRPSDD